MIFHDDSRKLEGNTWSKRNSRRKISWNFPIDNQSSSNDTMLSHGDDDSKEFEGNTWNKRNPRREISRNFPIDNQSSSNDTISHGNDDSREFEGNTWSKRNSRKEISRNFPIDNPLSTMIFHGDDDSRELEGNTWSKSNSRKEISRNFSIDNSSSIPTISWYLIAMTIPENWRKTRGARGIREGKSRELRRWAVQEEREKERERQRKKKTERSFIFFGTRQRVPSKWSVEELCQHECALVRVTRALNRATTKGRRRANLSEWANDGL